MSRIARSDALTREIEYQTRSAVEERNPLQKAYDSYHEMERDRDLALQEVTELITSNSALLAEIGMLREHLHRSEVERIRFQSISNTLLGRLLAINDTIAGAVKASLAAGIEPAETEEQLQASVSGDTMEDLSDADREAIQRIVPKSGPKLPTEGRATPVPPLALGGAIGVPAVDWGQKVRPR
jgi:hypothetical protein